jgi:hypothetical protein
MDNKTAIYQTIKDAREYLKFFKLGLEVRTSEDDIFEMKRTYGDFIGMYEHESIFSGNIIIYLNVDSLEEASEEDDFYYDVIVTIYHEIGHALFELIMSIPEEDVQKYEDVYFNVFFDDNGIDEEELVEDFGQSFDPTLETKSELRELLSQMLSDDFDFWKYI